MAPTLLKSGRHGVIPWTLNASLMASKPRASGKHALGSRTRAAGYKGKSGWSEYNMKLVAANEVTVHDVATKRLQVSTALFCTRKIATSKINKDAEQHGTSST